MAARARMFTSYRIRWSPNVKRMLCAALAALVLAGCGAYTPTLSPQRNVDVFGRIQPGMTEAEVEQLIGVPDEKMPFPLSGNHAWTYRYYDPWGYMAEFSVTFGPDGRMVSKISRRFDGGDRGSK